MLDSHFTDFAVSQLPVYIVKKEARMSRTWHIWSLEWYVPMHIEIRDAILAWCPWKFLAMGYHQDTVHKRKIF